MTMSRARGCAVRTDPRFADVTLLHAEARHLLYDARDAVTGRRVVLKVPSRAGSAWASDAIEQEGVILGRIGGHPHVVTLYEQVRLRDGRPALVLERAAGSLADLTGAYRPALPRVVSLGIKLCGALETLHGAGWLHTDVRPAGALVTEWGEFVLAGFDAAVRSDAASAHALHTTTPFTAPELLEGGRPTAAADVYGLAVTLYEVLAGRSAFPAYAGEPESETSLRILRGVHAPLPATLPIPLRDLLEWAMAVEPKHRPPSAAWLGEELRRIEHGQGWPRTPLVAGSIATIDTARSG